MKRLWVRGGVLLLLAGAGVGASVLLNDEVLSVRNLAGHRARLLDFVASHYLPAVLSYIALYSATALFLPGALVLTLAGGVMFGTWLGALYADIGGTLGAVLAFIVARRLVGHAIQERFADQLQRFNKEMEHHGPNYLLVLRLVPIAPFFVINYCAAVTRIPLGTFVWTTAAGMFPGSLVYAFTGSRLRYIEAPSDLLSGKVLLALGLLALLALVPVVVHHWQSRSGKGERTPSPPRPSP